MDRRTFVKTGASLAAAGCVPPCLVAALKRPQTLAIVDVSLAKSRVFADTLARRGLPFVDVRGDVGALWFATLASHLARTNATLTGVVRASDFFVLKHLAASAGRRPSHVAVTDAAGSSAAVTFVIDRRSLAAQNR